VLSDVAIISDTDIWAVGAVYLDSADGNPDPSAYNVVHWNGSSWQLGRIYFSTVCGQPDSTPYPVAAIFALSGADVWIAGAGEVVRFNGQSYGTPVCVESPTSFAVNKLWGNSDNSMYAVGYGGNIFRYVGGNWNKLSTGTTTDILDIWGVGGTAYCAVTNAFDTAEEKRILKITNGNNVDSIEWVGREVGSVWTPDGTHLYTAGDGVFENDGSGWKEMNTGASIFTSSVRGNANNDFVVVGGFGFIAHWNGADFNIFPAPMDAIYTRVAMKGDMVVAVGMAGSTEQAVITVGRR
jgi:hypothetical protein